MILNYCVSNQYTLCTYYRNLCEFICYFYNLISIALYSFDTTFTATITTTIMTTTYI